MKLNDVKIGESAVIKEVGGEGSLRQHFLDMGVIPNTVVKVVKYAPMGDPIELLIHGYELTLRVADAEKIKVETVKDVEEEIVSEDVAVSEHPGFGESGKYHIKEGENPLPKGTILSFALAGNQNSGKTTLFNQLTGANQHVGNFPGVTVDRKSGAIRNEADTLVTDLPGIYSLSPYSSEEIVSREFILNEKPAAIIDIVDATNIERNLYLTLQLMELNVPMVIALNMMDEVKGNGGTIRINRMEEMLGVPVIPISASKNEGVKELVDHAMHVAKYQEFEGRTDFCKQDDNGGAVHRALHGIMHLIEDHAKEAGIPIRFCASKLIEGDKLIEEALHLTDNEKEMIEHIIVQMEEERGLDRAAAIADMRFTFINELCKKTVVKPKESKERKRSRKIDSILTGKWTALPIFVLLMGLIFYLTFELIGGTLQGLLDEGIQWLSNTVSNGLKSAGASEVLQSLVVDGIFAGIGSVLSFIPIILLLFFFLSMLEDSGYMARVAFITDKLLRKIGLSGRSIVPMLIGFGCTVPGVMASRTLPSVRDRKMTILLTPFMSCTAKLPIYTYMVSELLLPNFKFSWLVILGLYLLGIVMAILVALVSKKTTFKGEAVPFVMELPNYRMPGAKNVMQLLWDKTKDFLKRAFTIIFVASIVIWFLQSFDFAFNMVDNVENSMLAQIAGVISPIFAPLGLGSWKIVTALITGFMAKESVVSTLEVLNVTTLSLAPINIVALLVFCLLYTPCVAAIASIRRELGKKWAFGIVLFQCGIAYLMAGVVVLIGLIFGL